MLSTATSASSALYDLHQFPLETAPEGEVTAFFVQGIWGKSNNLFCCFATEQSMLFRLSTFANNDYAPSEAGPNMRYAQPEERYRLTIGRSRAGAPTFLRAELLDG
jgi:hypothetical protein